MFLVTVYAGIPQKSKKQLNTFLHQLFVVGFLEKIRKMKFVPFMAGASAFFSFKKMQGNGVKHVTLGDAILQGLLWRRCILGCFFFLLVTLAALLDLHHQRQCSLVKEPALLLMKHPPRPPPKNTKTIIVLRNVHEMYTLLSKKNNQPLARNSKTLTISRVKGQVMVLDTFSLLNKLVTFKLV